MQGGSALLTTPGTASTATAREQETPAFNPGSVVDASMPILYENALQLTRKAQYDKASQAYERLLCSFPGHAKGWISYGQMQKKRLGGRGSEAAYHAAHTVLQRGAAAVEAADSGKAAAIIVQALGLLDMQYGRQREAVQRLQQAVQLDDSLAPVLQWKAVRETIQAEQPQ